MKNYHNVVENQQGVPVPFASVLVRITATQLPAVIYSDDGVTAIANPLTTDGFGRFNFYVNDGVYDLQLSGQNIATFVLHAVEIADVTEFSAGDEEWQTQFVFFAETPTGILPPAGNAALYSKTDGNMYYMTAGGSEVGPLGNNSLGVDIRPLNNTFTGQNTFTGNTLFKAGDVWFDVRAFGAKVDGLTDDTVAVQAALTAANAAGGGKVFIPATGTACLISGQLILDGFNQVELCGPSSGQFVSGSNPQPATLRFTGNPTGRLISVRSTNGVTLRNLFIQSTNAAFVGLIVDSSHSGLALDTENLLIESCFVGGASGAANAAACVGLDKTIISAIQRCSFGFAAVGVQGLATTSSYSNAVQIENTLFGGTGGFSVAHIQSPGQGWTIKGCTFEIGFTGTQNVIDGSATHLGFNGGNVYTGNWFGDPGVGWSGSVFFQIGNGNSLAGNFVSGQTTATAYTFASADNGTIIAGNLFETFAIGFLFPSSNQTDIRIVGNNYSGVADVFNGAPLRGLLDDGAFTYNYGFLWLSGNNPALEFLGTEGSAKNWYIQESAGTLLVGDATDSLNVLRLTNTAATFATGIVPATTTFSALGTAAPGTLLYCSNCTIANPCAAGGTGAIAKLLNSIWVCS